MPHVLAFVREQILAVHSVFAATNVVVIRPRPSWLERSWATRQEETLDFPHLTCKHIFAPFATAVTPFPVAGFGLLRILPPLEFRKPGILHAHFLYPQGYMAVRWSEKAELPCVVTGHGYDVYALPHRSKSWREAVMTVVKGADVVTTVSDSNKADLVALGANSNRIRVIPNSYDPSVFLPKEKGQARVGLSIAANRKVILFVGNLEPNKQVDRLLRAFKDLSNRRAGMQLAIVGGGPEKAKLQRMSSELGISGAVKFVGEVRQRDVAEWIAASDVLCLPSLKEGLPTVLIEAMASGQPVVASAVGAVPTLVTDKSGIIVAPKGIPELSDALDTAMSREWDSTEIAATVEQFARPQVRERWKDIYESLA